MLLTQLQHHHHDHRGDHDHPDHPLSPQHDTHTTQTLLLGGPNGAGSLSSPTQTTSSNLSSRSNNSQSSSPVSSTDLSSCLLKDADEDEDAMMLISPASTERDDNFSALQRLQFALEKNSLFAGVFSSHNGGHAHGEPTRSPSKKQRSRSRPARSPEVRFRHDEEETMLFNSMGSNGHDLSTRQITESAKTEAQCISLEPAIPDNIFQCPLCSITCNERHSFNEHLVTHTQQTACSKCDFITNDTDELQEHLHQVHGLDSAESGMMEDDEVPVPKTNSQSKTKKFKCKTCDHVSVTKTEFWAHTKSHIKQDKMLQCPKCPFVTEYKHHLEYHLRNHTGSKPFQCSHCSYSCVNKSMLASHLKSHSTIYQYRCADCDYATKYCHSLKMHLRKHGHSPQMVLNPDGTPNPLPIIDVYGTRRGPKLKKPNYSLIPITQLQVKTKKVNKTPPRSRKPKKESGTGNGEPNNNNPVCNERSSSEAVKRQHQQPLQIPNPKSSSRQSAPVVKSSSQKRERTPEKMQNMQVHQQTQFQPPKSTPTSTMLQGLLLQNTNPYMKQAVIEEKQSVNTNNVLSFPAPNAPPKNMLELYASALNQYLLANNPVLFHQLLANNGAGLGGAGVGAFGGLLSPMAMAAMANLNQCSPTSAVRHEIRHGMEQMAGGALDLSAVPSSKMESESPSPPMESNSRKRNRKGRALRFDRTQLLQREADEDSEDELQRFDDSETVLDFSNAKLSHNNNNNNNNHSPGHKVSDRERAFRASELSKCKYCDISFPDQFLYKMHMSYHHFGDSEPFLCKCGTKTKDKVAFFIHLTTEPH